MKLLDFAKSISPESSKDCKVRCVMSECLRLPLLSAWLHEVLNIKNRKSEKNGKRKSVQDVFSVKCLK